MALHLGDEVPWKHESTQSCLNSLGDKAYLGDSEGLHCNGTWDAILCWPATLAGSTVKQPCPPIVRGIDYTKFGFRECRADGQWAGVSADHPDGLTDYSECYTTDSRDILLMHFSNSSLALMKSIARGTRILEIVGLSISFVALMASLIIFCRFKNLSCDRTRMHRNLFLAILCHDVILLTVHTDQAVAMRSGRSVAGALVSAPGTIYATPIVCEIICVLVEYTRTVTFMWMLIEGIHLHNTIVSAVYASHPNYFVFYSIGWGFALLPTGIWTAVNIHKNSNRCWFLYQFQQFYWIIEGPRIFVICVNCCFLLSIVRELIKKLRANNSSDVRQAWKAVRATLILLPLLGMNNILSMTKPPLDQDVKFALWSYSAIFFSSFQGFFISLFYCFINEEVRSIVSLRWRRRQSAILFYRNNERSRSTTLSSPVIVVLDDVDVYSSSKG